MIRGFLGCTQQFVDHVTQPALASRQSTAKSAKSTQGWVTSNNVVDNVDRNCQMSHSNDIALTKLEEAEAPPREELKQRKKRWRSQACC